MKLSVIITAGGTSSRYGQTNKLLEQIDGKEVIIHSIEAFLPFNPAEIIISTSESLELPIVQLLKDYNLTNVKLSQLNLMLIGKIRIMLDLVLLCLIKFQDIFLVKRKEHLLKV